MAQAVSEGVSDAGFKAELFRVPETLPDVVIEKMGATSFQTEFRKLPVITPDELSKVDMPMGFDIGGNSPAEIAISIVAKLVAVMNGRILKINNEEKISYTYAGQDRDNNRCW